MEKVKIKLKKFGKEIPPGLSEKQMQFSGKTIEALEIPAQFIYLHLGNEGCNGVRVNFFHSVHVDKIIRKVEKQ